MINYIIIVFLSVSSLFAYVDDFKTVPIQESGRIKPLDTFARNQLLALYSKRALKTPAFLSEKNNDTMSAIEWLLDIIIYPNQADKYKVFNIRNPEVVGSLGLHWDTNHLYNRNEILIGLQHQLDYIAKIQQLSQDDLTSFDQQMLLIYKNVIRFQELCFSFSCLIKSINS